MRRATAQRDHHPAVRPNPVAFSPVSAGGEGTAHGTYGDLVMHSDGSYSYVANAAYDALTAGQVVTDVFKMAWMTAMAAWRRS